MIIPFVASPIVATLIGYFAIAVGFIEPLSVMVPWTTPPILSALLASKGILKLFGSSDHHRRLCSNLFSIFKNRSTGCNQIC